MKYTRLEIGKSSNLIKHKRTFIFLILLPVIAILAGKLLTSIFVYPYIKNNITVENKEDNPIVVNSNNKNEIKTNFVKIKSYNYYYVQAGVFTNIGNAKNLTNSLKLNRIKSFIIKDEGKFRVILDINFNKDRLKNAADKLRKSGSEVLLSGQTIGGFDKIGNANVVNYIYSLMNIFKIENDVYAAGKYNNADIKKVKSAIIIMENEYKRVQSDKNTGSYMPIVNTLNRSFRSGSNNIVKGLNVKNRDIIALNLTEEAFILEKSIMQLGQVDIK